jgi:phospholipid/cholesterol/gamma-HCH transport system substrate-binding protein
MNGYAHSLNNIKLIMKKKAGNKIKLGVIVTASIAFFIAAIYSIGQRQQLFSTTFQVSGVFKDISGLQVGNNVRFSGINVGVVQNIQQITDSTVKVDMMVDERARKFIKKNAKAIIGSDGFIGNKIISILPGSPGMPELSNNDIIETTQPVNIDDILLSVKTTSNNLASITGNLSIITQNVSEGKGTIGKLIMDSVLAQNVYQAMINIKQGAGGFKQNMDAAGHNFLLRGYLNKKEKEKAKKNGK